MTLVVKEQWLSCRRFADLASIPERTARHALMRSFEGKPVQKWTVRVRAISGRGGRAGVRYEVALSSLSEELQNRFKGISGDAKAMPAVASPIVGCGYRPAPRQSERVNHRYRVIQEAIDTPPRSAERKWEVERAAKKWNIPTRTIYGWIKRLEDADDDLNALARKLPSDAGKRRVWVSRQFDAAWVETGRDAAELPAIGAEIDQLICRAWASPAQRAGWEQVRRVALTLFKRDLAARSIELPESALYVSQRRIMTYQRDRRLDIMENDRKRWDDMKPRIRRDATGLAPMEIVVMDVKPLDCIVRRADGTTAWPKMIGFMDWGTHRTFRCFVLLAQGEGVRQEHVIDAFKAMVSHPEWGFPQRLYRDNGTEFAMFDKIRDALGLINEPGVNTVINAKPYSGASKPIESKFATLDRFVFSQMLGWAGGDRMNKKTQTVGKPPAPYPGSFADFASEAEARIAQFETYRIKTGYFAGRSPAEWYAAKVADGWRPVRVDPLALEAAFARRDTRRVDRGGIAMGALRYDHPELWKYLGDTLEVATPYQRGSTPLVNLPATGWAALQEVMPFLPGEIEGAIRSGRAQRDSDRSTRRRRRELPAVVSTEALSSNVVTLPTRAAHAPLIDLDMSEQARSFAAARREAIEQKEAALADHDQLTARERRDRARDAITEALERQYGKRD